MKQHKSVHGKWTKVSSKPVGMLKDTHSHTMLDLGKISSIIVALGGQNSLKPILNHTVTKVISFYNNSGPFEMSKGQRKLHLGVIWTIYGQVWV